MTRDAFDGELDQRLREQFRPPDNPGGQALAALRDKQAQERKSGRGELLFFAAAGALAAGVALVLTIFPTRESTVDPGPELAATDSADTRLSTADLQELYAGVVRDLPRTAPCVSKLILSEMLRQRYQAEPPINVDSSMTVHGPMSYDAWPEASVLVAEIPEYDPVVLLLAKATKDSGPSATPPPWTQELEPAIADGGLRVHRRVVDAFVVYEVSNANQPICIDLIRSTVN